MEIQTSGRTVAACLIGCSAAPFAFAVTAGLTVTPAAPWVAAALVAVVLAELLRNHPVVALDWTGCSRAFLALGVAAAIVAIVLVSRLTVFMVDPAQTSWSTAPSSEFEVRHLCLTAYFVAALAALLWVGDDGRQNGREKSRRAFWQHGGDGQ